MQHRIGLVGCGGIAGSWIKAVDLQEDCRIELTYDLSLEAAKARAAEVGVEAVADLDEIWRRDEIDLVIICTPTSSHPDLVAQAAQAASETTSAWEQQAQTDAADAQAARSAIDTPIQDADFPATRQPTRKHEKQKVT